MCANKTLRDKARKFAVHYVGNLAFEGRKGHGGAVPITKRVLTPEQLERQLHAAISRYEDGLRHYNRVAQCETLAATGFMEGI